ncbi:hypothetical protein GE061_015594 [Apolygus lucorum]|uniref:E3 ubiquitin-protein ligase Topors n=1 Tax=Apolygus lucorum TaxID=248454 RepID=A0A8S9XLD4_APOLU|nr:hypothetical protein GE061_015594 [Apolygus lucorum]
MERSPSPRQRPSSPDVVCPICLGEITNKAVTDSCLHSFCFSCLSEWSKVKPECPLCKQKFSIIYHTIRSMGDYQEYRIDRPLDLARAPHGLLANLDAFDPHIFINVAVQRATRFGYRTTMGVNRNGRTPLMFWMPPEDVSQRRRVPQILRSSPHGSTAFAATSGSSSRSSSSSRPNRTPHLEFRRNVYQQNIWVRPSDEDRVRESSPEFYRENPAQTHRLVPWLTRELSVLLEHSTTPFYHELACRQILGWISVYPINSYDFKRLVQPYFGGKTDHFVHEFYHYAISPHDLPAYDNTVRYTASHAELESTSTDDLILENLSTDSNIDPVQFRRPDVQNSFGYGFPVPRRPLGTLTLVPPTPRAPNDIIVVSSDEEPPALESDSDSEVMIIGSLPPMHLRVPEVITLDDSGDDSDVIEIKPATPPLIEIADGSDSEPNSPSHPSTSNGIAGTSSSQPDAPMNLKRTARFFRPSYREYSSSSDEDFVSKKKSPKKKIPERKRPSRSSSRRFKSLEYVDPSSSNSDGFEKEDSGDDQRVSRRKRQSSSDDDSQAESNDMSQAETKRRSSKDSKSSKKSSSSANNCPKCLKPKKKPTSTSPTTRTQVPEKRRSHSISSDSSEGHYSRSKQRNKRFAYDHEVSPSSSISLDVETEFNPSQEPTSSLAPNPKALSKKAIILNKRKTEMFDAVDIPGPSISSNGSDENKLTRRMSDTDLNEPLDNKESIGLFECPRMSDSPSISYNKMRPEEDLVRQLPGMPVYSSDTSSSILSMGQEYMPGFDVGGSNGHSSSTLQPQNDNGCLDELSGGNLRSDWDQTDVPTRPPSICSTSSSSSSDSASSSHSILNVTSVDPPPLDQSDDSYPELTLNPVVSGGDDLSAVASSPPNLRRFDDASSPFISLNHSPLQSDSSSLPSPSHTSATSPPRLKSIVLRVPSPSRRQPQYPSTSSPSSSSNEDDD